MAHPFTPSSDQQTRPALPATVLDAEQLVRYAFGQSPWQGYELLFRRFYQPLCTHAIRYVYAKEVAENIVSDVFLNLWRSGAYLSIQTTFQAY